MGTDRSASPATVLRVLFGVAWAVDASLKWLPGYRATFASTLDAAAKGQPGWLHPWFSLWTGLSPTEAHAFAYMAAATETLLAAALITGFARKSTYLAGAAYALLVWATGEGFGGPYQSGSTDIGAAIIYVFVFVSLLVVARHTGPDRYSVDFRLERRFRRWTSIAEVRRPAPSTIAVLSPVTRTTFSPIYIDLVDDYPPAS